MKVLMQVVVLFNKAKITQKDRFILLLILCLIGLVNSLTALLFMNQLPDLLERILKEVLKLL